MLEAQREMKNNQAFHNVGMNKLTFAVSKVALLTGFRTADCAQTYWDLFATLGKISHLE